MSIFDRFRRSSEPTEKLDRDARILYPEWTVETGAGRTVDLPTMLLEEGVRHPIVSACRRAIYRAASEPLLRWVDDEGVRDSDTTLPDGVFELERLLRRPQRRYTQKIMVGSVAQDLATYGNTFQPILGADSFEPVGLGYVSPLHITPVMNREVMRIDGYRIPLAGQSAASTFASTLWGTRYLAAQALQPAIDPDRPGDYLPDRMVHMMMSPSSLNPQVGASPLDDILPILAEDEEWVAFSAWQAINRAETPGIVSPTAAEAGRTVEPEQLKKVKADIEGQATGRNRGRLVALPYPIDYNKTGSTIDSTRVNEQHATADVRVPMTFGIHPSLLPTRQGMLHAPLSDANIRAVREFFTEVTLIPLWKHIEEQLTIYLGDLFTMEGRLEFDLGQVRALAVDRAAEAERVGKLLMAGLLTYNQALTELGYEEIGADGEYRLASTSHEVIPADGLGDVAEVTSGDAQAALSLVGGTGEAEAQEPPRLPSQAGGAAAG